MKDAVNVAKHGVSLARAKDLNVEMAGVDAVAVMAKPVIAPGGCSMAAPTPWLSRSSVVAFVQSVSAVLTSRSIAAMSHDDNEAWLTAQPEPDLTDPDNPEWTEKDFARAIPADRLPPEILAAFPKTKLGRPKSPSPKVAVKLRIDPDVLGAYKATGPGWQTRMNAALRLAMPD